MAETKTQQKNWKFTPQILSELENLCAREMRSEQNMVEVLIHNEFLLHDLKGQVKDRGCEDGKLVS